MLLSGLVGWVSFRPDLALWAILLFFDILKLERAALLSINTSAGKQTFSLSLFSSCFFLFSSFFFKEAFLNCFPFSVLSSFVSWLKASYAGAVPHMRHVAPAASSGRHFSFLCSPQLPVEWKPFKVCVAEGSFVNLFAPRSLPFIRAHICCWAHR